MASYYEIDFTQMEEERKKQREEAMNKIIQSEECMAYVNTPFKFQNNNINTVEEMKKVKDEIASIPEWAKDSLHMEALWHLRQKVHETMCEVCSSTKSDEFGDIPMCELACDNIVLFRTF